MCSVISVVKVFLQMKKRIETPDTLPATCLTAVILAIFIIIASAGGCTNKISVEALEAKIITPVNDVNIKEGESVFFQGYASGGVPPYSYLWYFGKGASDSEKQNTGEVFFNFEGAYKAILTVTDSNGNKDNAVIRVFVSPR